MANALANAICERCKGGFAPAEKIVNSNGELYHEQCFVCAQCFQQFPEGLFYEVSWLKCFSPMSFLAFVFYNVQMINTDSSFVYKILSQNGRSIL